MEKYIFNLRKRNQIKNAIKKGIRFFLYEKLCLGFKSFLRGYQTVFTFVCQNEVISCNK